MKDNSISPNLSGISDKSRTALGIGVIILLVGAVLRLGAFDETLILPDQSAILDAAFQVAHFRYFPSVGMKSSAGVMQTGLVPLLAAIPLLIVKRVIAVQWFMSVLDLLALAWLYRVVRKTIGQQAAGIAALLYATAPWVILYTRTIWYQTLLAAFATTAFAGILTLLSRNRNKGPILVLTMVSTTMMSMVHLAGAPWGLLLFCFYVFLAYKHGLWRWFWLGLGTSGALVLPYFIYLIRSSFSDVAYILKAGTDNQGLNTAAYRLSKELITGTMVVANAHGDLWDRSIIRWDTAATIILAILGISLLWACLRIIQKHQLRPLLLFVLTWLLVVPALFLMSDIHLQHFYLMMLFPAPYVLIGAWVEAWMTAYHNNISSKLMKITGVIAAVFLVLIALWWSSLWMVRIQLEAHGLLERSTRGWLMDRAADEMTRYLQDEPGSQVIILTGHDGDMSSFEWLRGYSQNDAIRVVSTGKGFLLPESPTCYLLGPGVPVQVLSPVADIVTKRPDMVIPANPPWQFFCWTTPIERPDSLAQWDNGMHLLKSEVTGEFRSGEHLNITHTWSYQSTELIPAHFFNHLLLDGVLIAQVDGGSVPYWYWRDGDMLLTYFSLVLPAELPDGDYTLRTGMYTWPGLERILRVSGDDGYDAYTFTKPSP